MKPISSLKRVHIHQCIYQLYKRMTSGEKAVTVDKIRPYSTVAQAV